MEQPPKQEKPIFDFSAEALVKAIIEKADPKKVWTITNALQRVLFERGLEETEDGDWVDKVTKQRIIDAALFYELLSKAAEEFMKARVTKTQDPADEHGVFSAEEKKTLQGEQHFLRDLEGSQKHWYQEGQYE